VNKTFVVCLALLVLGGVTVSAQDSNSGIIHINGGATTVMMNPSAKQLARPNSIEAPADPFYDNIRGGGYQPFIGWAVCDDDVNVNGCRGEWTPANRITSLKTGTTKKISVGLGFLQGTNRSLVVLTADCKNMPCTTPDGAPKGKRLCSGTVKNMPIFSDTTTQVVSFNCVVKLTKGKNYWVLIESPANSDLAWNYSNSADGGTVLGENDRWDTYQSSQPTGALTIQ
jgi:hypothetical protein